MVLIVVLVILNIPVYYLLMKMFFEDWDGLWEAIAFFFTPQIISAFRGKFWEDWWDEFKLVLYIFSSFAIVYTEYYFLAPYFLK